MNRASIRVAALLALLAVLILAGVCFGGASSIDAASSWRALWAGPDAEGIDAVTRVLIWDVRLPRVLVMALAGAALALCGAALQSALRNPLADPGLLGVSSGASLGAVIAIVAGAGSIWPESRPIAAFVGALVTLLAVHLIGHAFGSPSVSALLLIGVALASLFSAIVSVLLLGVGDHRVREIVAWLLGAAQEPTWRELLGATIPVSIGVVGLLLSRRVIDALSLGEEQALSIGVDVARARIGLFALIALAAGGAVSVTGPVAFVGLMVPHIARLLFGASARTQLPAAACLGATLLVGCDLAARLASRSFELPVGVVTALTGVPFFLFLVTRLESRSVA